MSDLIQPGVGLLFMKVGIHAREPLASIIARKTKEIEDEGFSMWGYGGNTCHPRTMVQPFAAAHELRGEPIVLVMNEMTSTHWAEQVRATQFSVDDQDWKDMPDGINVLGSRFALVIEDLRREEFVLPLDHTRVALGLSQGRAGSRYVQGRVDKACLEVVPDGEVAADVKPAAMRINLVAKLRKPYAVFLK